MGKPKKVEAATVATDYDWGDFGSANENGVNLSPMASANVQAAQSGVNQYLQELLNPSYNNASFKARQDLIDTNMRQSANEMGAAAIARGARGSATQSILNSLMANRNNELRNAMVAEDARIQNVLNSAMGVENNYFNQSNTMANNILDRVKTNQAAQQEVNKINAQNEQQWKNSLLNAGVGIAGAALGGGLGGGLLSGLTSSLLGSNNVTDSAGNTIGKVGGYGTYNPNAFGLAVDPMQVESAHNWIV